jgi:hypothetical protein
VSENKIISLCVSCEVNNRTKLFRVADLDGINLVPFHFDGIFGTTNREIIHTIDYPQIGTINFWEWSGGVSAEGRPRQFSEQVSINWIEYFAFKDTTSLDLLVQKLEYGISGIDVNHDYLFEYENHHDYKVALYCRGTDFEFLGNIAKIKQEIERCYSINVGKNEIATIKSQRYFPNLFKYYYLHTEDNLVLDDSNITLIHTPQVIIAKRLLNHIKKYFPEASKKDKTTIRSFINNIPQVDFITEIAQAIGVDRASADTYVQEFLLHCEKYIDGNDIEETFLSKMIDNDLSVAERFTDLIQKKWEEGHQEYIQKLDSLKKEIESKNKEFFKLEEDIKTMESTRKKKLEEASKINQKISNKLKVAKDNIADFMAEYAIYTGALDGRQETDDANQLILGKQLKAGLEIDNIEELIDGMKHNLRIAGVENGEKAQALAIYLLVAYFLRIPLIIAGFGAQSILDALSSTLFCRTANYMYCCGNTDINQLVKQDAQGVVASYEAWQNNSMSKIIYANQCFSGYICFVATTADELFIETKDVYDYALPVFTKYFISKRPQSNFAGSHFIGEFDIEQKFDSKILLPDMVINDFAYFQCKTLMSTIKEIKNVKIEAANELLLQAFPIMTSLGKKEKLQDIVSHNNSLSKKDAQYLNQLCEEL